MGKFVIALVAHLHLHWQRSVRVLVTCLQSHLAQLLSVAHSVSLNSASEATSQQMRKVLKSGVPFWDCVTEGRPPAPLSHSSLCSSEFVVLWRPYQRSYSLRPGEGRFTKERKEHSWLLPAADDARRSLLSVQFLPMPSAAVAVASSHLTIGLAQKGCTNF